MINRVKAYLLILQEKNSLEKLIQLKVLTIINFYAAQYIINKNSNTISNFT